MSETPKPISLPPAFDGRLLAIADRAAELKALLAVPGLEPQRAIALTRELAEVEPVAEAAQALLATRRQRAEAQAMAEDAGADPELRDMAQEEVAALAAALPGLERAMLRHLLPRDEADARGAIIEVRAGTGGDEAALFAGELFRMYERYAALRGWRFELLEFTDTPIGGAKEAIASVSGRDVFARLKFESGVHRVQRVPVTENQGRIHTSAATVAVLPEAEEVDVTVDDKDLRIDVFRASGAGGQHVNKTESAVRITHLPSGIVVSCQDEKSQHKNKARAMKILRARLFEAEREAKHAARSADRKAQVGSGDRSERIRTYNFPQGRVTDHRINLTLYKIEQVMAGTALDEVVEALLAEDEAQRLASME